jgi:nicotinamidase/pyrazinamidase
VYNDKKPFDTIDLRGGFGGGRILTLWPDHCVQNTPGADFHPKLKIENCKKDFYIFKKGEDVGEDGYSAFEHPSQLASFLDGKGISQLFVCGLATDYCVKESAIDAADKGFDVYVIEDACKEINHDLNPVYKAFTEHEVKVIESFEIDRI